MKHPIKHKNKPRLRRGFWIAVLILALAASLFGIGALAEESAAVDYYVCFAKENYALRNANRMTSENGLYLLKDVTLDPQNDFYITDNAGRRWYAKDGDEMAVKEVGAYAYTIAFSPDGVFDEENGAWTATGCHISYAFYEPAVYSLTVAGEEMALTYNPFESAYDCYYISSLYLEAGANVAFGEERHAVPVAGYYRILFTPGEVREGNRYAFNDKGMYGSGDGYVNTIYIEDAPQYYLLPKGSSDYLPLSRYENNVGEREYRSAPFFVGARDTLYEYALYEQEAGGAYRLIDDDKDENTVLSQITVADVGWYVFSFTDGGDSFVTACIREARDFGGYYLAAEANGWGFDAEGHTATQPRYFFAKVEEGDEDYNEDYEQYLLYLALSEKDLADGDFEFLITDGDSIYRNGLAYITVSRAGYYKILFSDEHFYGNGRAYRYLCQEEEAPEEEIRIGSVEEFLTFARLCRKSADYSKNKAFYLTADLDFDGVDFIAVGDFSGIFHGGYHVLKNITLSKDTPSVFEVIKRDGRVERLRVENLTQTDKTATYVGFVGRNFGVVSEVSVTGRLTGDSYVGAIAGYNGRSRESENTGSGDSDLAYRNALLENCESAVTLSGSVHSGGICGFNLGEIAGCVNTGAIAFQRQSASSSPFTLGGIAGYSAGKISDCRNEAAVAGGDALYVGGICGMSMGEFYFAENRGAVSGYRYTGGIVGYYGTLANNQGDRNEFFGGMAYEELYRRFFGENDPSFEEGSGRNQLLVYCVNEGTVTSLSYAGGIIGYADSQDLVLTACQSLADLSVTAGSYVGGIIGYAAGPRIESSLSAGRISAKGLGAGDYVGGIAGWGGDITACFSICSLAGRNYLGGIVGYHQSGLSSSWANVILLPTDDSHYVGNIAGFSEALDAGADTFSGVFENNYYLEALTGSYGGIDGRRYGDGYDYAASAVTPGDFAFVGTVSPYLPGDFDGGDLWQGIDTLSYPLPRAFFEAVDCPAYGDDEGFDRLFERHAPALGQNAGASGAILYTVTLMEWNEDNGALYEDGVWQRDHYDILATLRLPLGAVITPPAFRWAQEKEGVFLYEGEDALYFVSFLLPEKVEGNTVIYATYKEAVTTLACEDDRVFVEGVFDKETKLELLRGAQGYSLVMTLDGAPLTLGKVRVKFRPDSDAGGWQLICYNRQGEEISRGSAEGQYLSFVYEDGAYFVLTPQATERQKTAWHLALIGGAVGAALTGLFVLTVYGIRKKVRRKQAKK